MIYFSEFKGKKVYTEDKVMIGVLEDLIFVASDNAKVTKLVLRNNKNEKFIVPVNYLIRLNRDLIIKKEFNVVGLDENELYVLKNILDKQIIDLKGNKIVRVNDVLLQYKNGIYISGVDIGILGILRWFKLENIFNKLITKFNIKSGSQFLSWGDIQPLELARGQVKLKKEEKRLKKLRPEDLADYLERINVTNTKKILRIIDEKFATEVIRNLNINYQTSLFKQFSPERAAKTVSFIDPDEAADILLTLSTKKRDQIFQFLTNEKRKEISYLLNLSNTPIGELIHSDYMIVSPEDLTRDVLIKIKKETSEFYTLIYVYVVNKENQLIGVFNLHELLLQDMDTPVYKFMVQDVIVVHLTTSIEIVLRKMIKYRIVSFPVIDDNKKLLGLVMLSDANEYIYSKIK